MVLNPLRITRGRVLVGLLACVCLAALLAPATAAPPALARVKYGGGGDWYVNPTGLPNLVKAINKRTTIRLAAKPEVVEPSSERIFDYPMLFITGHGQIRFTPKERANLRKYLFKKERANLRKYLFNGGFLHVDDNYGLDEFFRPELKKLFPDKTLVELPFGHPIYHALYDFPKGLPKIHEHHGGPPHGYAIIHEGRVVLFYSYNTDLNDGWEDADVHNDPAEKREQ